MKNGFLRFISVAAFCALATQASAAIFTFDAALSGPSESPPNVSPGTGLVHVTIDDSAFTMSVSATFSGLTSPDTAAHIHCCTLVPFTGTAGVVTTVPAFAGFPLGVTSGSYSNTLDMTASSSYNPAFVTLNGGSLATSFNTLLTGMEAGEAYFNIHTVNFPGGEIRGFLHAVPEPSTWAMMILGFAGIGFMAYRRRKSAGLAV
jgi:hypothetical protein